MIDTYKLIPQRKQSERLSGKTLVTIGLIKKDVVKIDSLLKEKLVLSKVRYSILRQKNERDRRSRREDVLESKKDKSQDYDVKSNKKRKGFGGFLGGILKAVLAGLGFTIFKSLPALLKIGKMIKIIATPLILGVTVFTGAIVRLARAATQVLPDVKGKDFQGASKKSIDDGIEGLKSAMIETAIAFAVGTAAGFGVSRLVRGKTFTEKQAVNFLETQKRELRAGKTTKAKKFNKKIRSERQRGLLIDDNFAINPKSKTFTQLAEVEVASEMAPRRIPKGMTPYQYQTLYGDAEVREIGEGSTMRGGDVVSRSKKGSTPRKRITKLKPDATTVRDATGRKRISTDPYEIAMQPRMEKLAKDARRMFPDFTNKQIIEIVRRERESSVRLKKLLPESELKLVDKEFYKRFKQAQRDINKQTTTQRMAAAFDKNKGKLPEKMTKAERLAQKAANEQRTIARKLASKKGLSKLLFRFGGEALEQSVKQTIKASVGVVPIIGDLIGFLLDVFLFGQPVGRAAFMATGSLLGGLIGGVFGLIGGPPGVLVGGILGGIGGDILGGALYDLLFERGVGARITDNLTDAFVKKGVKTGVTMGFMSGGYAPFGGIVHAGEFVIDADSTRAIERRSPGFLMALNKAKGSQVNEVLETYMSYGNEGEGSERLIPLPFEKIVTRTVVTNTGSKDDSSSPFMDLYRRG